MSVSAATLRKLSELSLAPEQMAGVLSIIAEMAEADERTIQVEAERKAKDRARKAAKRSEEKARTVHGQSTDSEVDIPAVGFPNKESSPTPPKEINPSPSLRSGEIHRVRATRIPETFVPDLSEAEGIGLSVEQAASEAENFKDYWRSKAANATKRDWPATWRVWCRKALNEKPNGASNGHANSRTNGKATAGETLRRSIFAEAEKRSRVGAGEAGPDERHEPAAGPPQPGGSMDIDLEIPAILRRY